MSALSTATPRVPAPALDKEKFNKKVQVVALKVPAKSCNNVIKALKHDNLLLDIPKMKAVAMCSVDDERLVLLNQSKVTSLDRSTWPAKLVALVEQQTQSASAPIESLWHEVHVDFDNYSTEEILRSLLPAGAEVPTSYEQIGNSLSVTSAECY
jgi:hypothetical protein